MRNTNAGFVVKTATVPNCNFVNFLQFPADANSAPHIRRS